MTSIVELLDEIRLRNICLWVEEDRLRYRAPKNALPEALLAQIKARKSEIIGFLQHANAQHQTQLPALEKVDRQQSLPLSFAQQRLWFIQQLDPDNTASNMPVVVKFDGLLDIEVLQRSIQTVVQRHEVLRTSFPLDGGQPTVKVEDLQVTLSMVDLLHLPEKDRDAEAYRLATQEARQPFDLINGPLFRCQLFKLQEQQFLCIWNMHCIICDGASSDVFYQDLTQTYQAFKAGQPLSLPELPVQYLDFADWQRQWLQGEALETQLSYWKEILEGKFPALKLPFDAPRPKAKRAYRGDRAAKMLPWTLNQAVLKLGQQVGATQFMILLSAFETLLYRYSSQEQFLINVASAGRGNVETERLVGFFSNTLLFKADLSDNPTFREFLLRVKQSSLAAFAHQDIPFAKVIEEISTDQQTQEALFQVKFALNPPWSKGRGMAAVHLPDLTITSLFGYIYHGETKYDLTLVMREQDEGLGMVFDYNADIFTKETIERMVEHFHTLLQGIVQNPDQPISMLPLLTEGERQVLLSTQSLVKAESTSVCVHQLFEAQVNRQPDAIALTAPNQQWTYQDLNQRANQLAHFLLSVGDITSAPVAIYLERSPEMVLAQLAILKVGGTYIPIEDKLSKCDLDSILTTAKVEIIVTTQNLAEQLETPISKIICLNSLQEKIGTQSHNNIPAFTSCQKDIACVLFDDNVGVKITHAGIILLVQDSRELNLSSSDRLLQWASPMSEVALFELYAALVNGGQIILPSAHQSLTDLGKFIEQHQVTTLVLPMRLFNNLVEHQCKQLKSVRQCLINSDRISPYFIKQFLQTLPSCCLWKIYSTPETSGFVCWQPIHSSFLSLYERQIGSPLANIDTYIFDQNQQLVPCGVEGNLYLGGARVAKGYLNLPCLDSHHCIPNPLKNYDSEQPEYLFFTGERAKCLSDGSIVKMGSGDSGQLLGQSICLQEIETVLTQHPQVKEGKAVGLTDPIENQPSLVAYVVATDHSLTSKDIYCFLKKHLPSHLIPSSFVVIEALPLTPQGEVDIDILPFPSNLTSACEDVKIVAQTPLEHQLKKIWEQVLKVQDVGITDNFFELGGNSLLAMSLAIAIEQQLEKIVPLSSFFQAPTIQELATLLQQERTRSNWRSLIPIQPKGSRPPLFCVHFILRPLTSHFDPDQPIYALRYGIASQTTQSVSDIPQRIELIAAHYIQEMRRLQPTGPYYLMGSSLGGTIAFEMAQQLLQQGEKVALLAIFDSSLWPRPPLKDKHQGLFKYLTKSISGIQNLISYRWRQLQFYIQHNGRYTPNFYWRESRLFKPYYPQFLSSKVLLFHALEEAAKYKDSNWLPQQWEKITDSLETIQMPGDHNGMLQEPHVHAIVQVLQGYIDLNVSRSPSVEKVRQ
ncbi:condensation domain-containing protein [Acaryochloris marina]|uniref:non-ribosomal peptide synthetase n=1 Tax=Acaryochloris marina TaxID=155978 RepID=UPI001BB01CDD|nr:condensation domain-containing protein [Acaryochloris marina]QUY44988.1 AMP-binding protein [Acaryochloris marina S15]